MGYSLECYALDHAALQGLVGSGRDATAICNAESRLFVGSPGLPWRAALRGLLEGDRGRQLAQMAQARPGLAQRASEQEQVAMTALIRYGGHRVGELVHNSRAGAKFRALFSPVFTPVQFAEPALAPLLLGRPLGYLFAEDYPRWGGLNRTELRRLLGERAGGGQASADRDQYEWLYTLFQILRDVANRGEDLVTLYL